MSDQFFWFVTRSSALLCWLSASLSMLVGLVTSSRLLGRRPTIPWLVDLHRLLAALTVTFLGLHMGSLWLDSFVKFRTAELLIPWVATVPGLNRTSIALGVIAAWLLAAVQISSLIKDRLPESVWRTIHLLSFGTLAAGTIHAVQVGSEADNPLVVGIGVSILTAIALAAAVRALRLRQAMPAAETNRPARSVDALNAIDTVDTIDTINTVDSRGRHPDPGRRRPAPRTQGQPMPGANGRARPQPGPRGPRQPGPGTAGPRQPGPRTNRGETRPGTPRRRR